VGRAILPAAAFQAAFSEHAQVFEPIVGQALPPANHRARLFFVVCYRFGGHLVG